VNAISEKFRPNPFALAGLGILLLFSAWLFFDTLEDLITGDPLIQADRAAYFAFRGLRSPWRDQVMVTITELGDTLVVTVMAMSVSAWLIWRRAWRTLAYWLAAIAGASAINSAIKMVLQRARPTELYDLGPSAFSFPSGHSTTNAVLYGFLSLILMRQMSIPWRVALAIMTLILVGLIALSRLYLAAHWLSDVIGGIGFGALWVSLLGLFYLHGRAQPIEPYRLLIGVGAILIIIGGFNIALHHSADMALYALRPLGHEAVSPALIPRPNPK
jgi:membrane-associated phospholipid phosphatase